MEKAIRRALNKPYGDLKSIDMIRLKGLDVSGQNIRSLSGIEWALNLRSLKAGGNRLTDITPLIENAKSGGLTEGASIDLTGNDLDFNEGSRVMVDIKTLMARGVLVQYGHQH